MQHAFILVSFVFRVIGSEPVNRLGGEWALISAFGHETVVLKSEDLKCLVWINSNRWQIKQEAIV